MSKPKVYQRIRGKVCRDKHASLNKCRDGGEESNGKDEGQFDDFGTSHHVAKDHPEGKRKEHNIEA